MSKTWMFAYDKLMGDYLLERYDGQPALLTGYQRSFNHSSTLL